MNSSKQEILSKIVSQLSCICKQYDIEFLFVGGIPDGDNFLSTLHIDGDCNLAAFIGEGVVNLEKQQPDFLKIVKGSYERQKTATS